MLLSLRTLASRLPRLTYEAVQDKVRGAIAAGLAVAMVAAIGITGRTALVALPTDEAAQAKVETSGGYVPTSDGWLDQLTNPRARRGGQYRGYGRRPLTRSEERELRLQEEREAMESRLREEREAREEALERAREFAREGGTYRTVCVRLCDGYFFPISFATTPDRFAADEAACQARCASPAKLYVYPSPGGEPEQMFDTQGRPYTALKNAFLYRTAYDESCTCKPHPWSKEARDRHRVYAERARGTRRAVAAKVQHAPRTTEATATSPTQPAAETADQARRPEGAMLLGASEPNKAPIVESAGRRERQRGSGRLGYGGRNDWRNKAFGND
jgi:hypothetical protein